MKRIPMRILMAAILTLAVLSTTAYAVTRPAVLEWLLGRGAPASEALTNAAQELAAENSADGVTIRITGAVYDRQQLNFSYEVENSRPEEPVLVAFDQAMRLNGQDASLFYANASWSHPGMAPSPHLDVPPVQRNPALGGAEAYIGEGLSAQLSGQVQCEVTLRVYRPAKGFAVVEAMDTAVEDPDLQDVLETLRSFRNTVLADAAHLDPDSWAEQGYCAIASNGWLCFDLEEELTSGRLLETACIPVTFTFDADRAVCYDFSGAEEIDLADCTLQIRRFRLTPLSTEVQLYLIPRENTREAVQALAEKYGAAALLDEQGQEVQYSEMDWLSSDVPYISRNQDGTWVCEYHIDMPGLLTFPQSVGFVTQAGEICRFELP